MAKSVSNNIQTVKAIITNDLSPDVEPNKVFKWFRASSGNYKLNKIEYRYRYEADKLSSFPEWIYYNCDLPEPDTDVTVVNQKNSGVEFYNPNLHELSQTMMNLYVDDDEQILNFYKKYGPLGVMPYLTNQSLSNFIDIVSQEIEVCHGEYSYWTSLFNLGDKFSFDPSEINESKEFVYNFNLLEDKRMYQRYSEPLYAVKYLITEYQLNCRLLCSKDTYTSYCNSHFGISRINEYNESYNSFYSMIKDETKIIPNLGGLKDFCLYAYCNSLLHAAYIYTVLNIQNFLLEKCKAPDCDNLFWKINNRSEYCSKTCKTRIGVRKHRKSHKEGK